MGVKATKEKMTVVVSSPDMDQPKILGSLSLSGQTGEDIFGGVSALLEQYQVADRIIGLSFDTTASNTGCNLGAAIVLDRALGRANLWLGCRRHASERHVVHANKAVVGPTTGPDEALFKQFS